MNVSQKILPMKYPPITSFHYHADLLSVLLNYDQCLPWFYNNFIQLFIHSNVEILDGIREGIILDFYTPYSNWKNCPHIYYQRINRNFVSKKWNSIIDFIIDTIDMDYYVYLDADQFFIPENTWCYKKVHKIHDMFIYGYDFQKKILYFTEYLTEARKYTYSRVTFLDFEKSYNSMLQIMQLNKNKIGNANGIEMISYRKYKLDYQFDISLAIDYLEDYLTGRNTYKRFRSPNTQWYMECNFGIKIYENIIKILKLILQKETRIDQRFFHVLWDHKKIMLLRIKFILGICF
jgi:hypothetical protein